GAGVRPPLLPGGEPRQGLHPRPPHGGRLGLRLLRRHQHRHGPHAPAAREGRARPRQPALPADGVGRRVQVRRM
ncbi:MAG: Phosphate regulon transcriptional regulatory protein PhoB (SphR), partial [uncultured Rubrobacteraceae bacterium]